jgi:peptidoglycan hydrolase-like protein with peptidoglycan-binding domain
VRSAQQELNRLGCFFGAVDGSLNAPTKAAVQRYQNDRGIKPSGDVEITDEFVSELKKQSGRVCPLVCMVGMIAEGEHCVDAKKAKPIVRRKDEDVTPAKQGHVKQEEKSTRRHETTPRVKEQPSGGGGHGSTIIGVGF